MRSLRPHTFVDVFAGAGGLSLGLMRAGWTGLFAVEKDVHAFATLRRNLIEEGAAYRYRWPRWLPAEPMEIGFFLEHYGPRLEALRGKVTLLAGGPPCQGYSSAGRRRRDDPRNLLFRHYVELARLLQPALLFFENVPGIAMEFDKVERRRLNPRGLGRPAKTYAQMIRDALNGLGYVVVAFQERAMDFGVPQRRQRFVMFGIAGKLAGEIDEAFLRSRLCTVRDSLLGERGLPIDRPVKVSEAISDLLVADHRVVESSDTPGFRQIVYSGPRTRYQELMHDGMDADQSPNSMRLANHSKAIVRRFAAILKRCRRGVKLSRSDRDRFGLSKSSTTPMDGDQPAHTLTSLPDDMIHYCEPRILSVREYARLQTFPDWYEFLGKYTTGGSLRRGECPRYTQVANAVPPMLAEAVGRLLAQLAGPTLRSASLPDVDQIAVQRSGIPASMGDN